MKLHLTGVHSSLKKGSKMPFEILSTKNLIELGLLQEVNRLFFHPRGLAMAVRMNEDGSNSEIIMLDYRNEPGGVTFDAINLEKFQASQQLLTERLEQRQAELGYIYQPTQEYNDDGATQQ